MRIGTHAQAGAAHRGLKRADGAAYAIPLDGRGGNDFLGWRADEIT